MPGRRRIVRNSGLRWLVVAAVACAVIVFALQRAEPVTEVHGTARVIDGDTMIIAGHTIRLAGLDAPEFEQICHKGADGDWACGVAARQGLVSLIAGAPVDCTGSEHDRYGRLVAVCKTGGIDLGAGQVRQGLAVARGRYAAEQADAQSIEAGLWSGEFDDPADWRRRNETGPGGMGLMDRILEMFMS